jgi:ribokinase
MAAVCVLGSVNMDLVVRMPHLPRPGETVFGEDLDTLPGGKGANQAVAAQRAGAQVRFVGAVGSDAFGTELRSGLAAEGIDVTGLQTVDGPSGIASIFVEASGENVIVVASGANRSAALTDASILDGCAAVLTQLEVPMDAVRACFVAARERGCTTVLNAAPAGPVPADVLALTDVLVVNEHELAAQEGAAADVPAVITTLGAKGLRLDRPGQEPVVVDGHVVVPVDTVGAGDACTGAIVAALAQGEPLETSIRWGNAAGALTTTAKGARTSPTKADIEDLLSVR